jgi:hypothetical protein
LPRFFLGLFSRVAGATSPSMLDMYHLVSPPSLGHEVMVTSLRVRPRRHEACREIFKILVTKADEC